MDTVRGVNSFETHIWHPSETNMRKLASTDAPIADLTRSHGVNTFFFRLFFFLYFRFRCWWMRQQRRRQQQQQQIIILILTILTTKQKNGKINLTKCRHLMTCVQTVELLSKGKVLICEHEHIMSNTIVSDCCCCDFILHWRTVCCRRHTRAHSRTLKVCTRNQIAKHTGQG